VAHWGEHKPICVMKTTELNKKKEEVAKQEAKPSEKQENSKVLITEVGNEKATKEEKPSQSVQSSSGPNKLDELD
jgi:hypothetical protein